MVQFNLRWLLAMIAGLAVSLGILTQGPPAARAVFLMVLAIVLPFAIMIFLLWGLLWR